MKHKGEDFVVDWLSVPTKSYGRDSDVIALHQAMAYLEKVRTEAREDRLKLPKGRKLATSFSVAAAKYIERLTDEGGKDIAKKAERLRLHLLPYFGERSIQSLTAFEQERYKKHRREQGASVATINRELAVVSHLLNRGEEWGWWQHKPAKVRLTREDNTKIDYLTVEQCDALLAAAKMDINPQIHLFILIGLETAMRRSEILSLKLENIPPEQGHLYIAKAKVGARMQPMTDRLADVLARELRRIPKGQVWLFPSIGKLATKTGFTSSIEEPFRRVVVRAGLDPKRVTPHTLRHTAISHLVQAGVDLSTIKLISGHKTLAMVERYSHLSGAHVRGALSKLQQCYEGNEQNPKVSYELHTPDKIENQAKPEKPTVTRLLEEIQKYPQGNSNPCRLREREVSRLAA